MGLAAINTPLVVSAAGTAGFAGLSTLEAAIQQGALSFFTVKVANALLYALNLYAVQQPGRLDGRRAAQVSNNKNNKKQHELFSDNRERSLVFPSGWAFAIWAVIFLGELCFCTSAMLVPASAPVATAIQKASAGFMMGQVFQVLWAASFRPKYSEGRLRYLSAFMLSGIAWSLSRAHAGFTSVTQSTVNLGQYILYFLPMSLHFGWTLAAALVNWNGSLAAPEKVSPALLAGAGHLSAVVATALGVSVTILRRAPVVGGVVAWALAACTTGMQQRLEKAVGVKDPQQAGIYGARVQKWLCGIGAAISLGTSLVVAFWKSV